MTSPFTDERDRIEQALTFHTGCEPSAQEIIDALNRAGYQITPSPGYDHSGNDNHLVAGDHGPVITPQAGEWQQECGSIGLQHQCGRCGCEYRSPPPQAGEAEPVATLHADGYWVLNKKHPNYTDIQYQSERGNWRLSVYRTAPPSPVAPMGYFVRDYSGELIPFACEADAREEAKDMGVAYIVAMPAPVAPVWQDIETAPRDGTEILVRLEVGGVKVVHIAWYRSAKEWEESGQHVGGWDSLEEWEGWWSYTRNSVSQEKLEGFWLPTHWMPLPPDSPGAGDL